MTTREGRDIVGVDARRRLRMSETHTADCALILYPGVAGKCDCDGDGYVADGEAPPEVELVQQSATSGRCRHCHYWCDDKVLDEDLDSALSSNSVELSSPILDIIATIEGEYDEADWHWLVVLAGGRVAYITGGCDYTGWDCQSHCEAFEEDSLKLAVRQIPEAYRDEMVERLPKAVWSGVA